MEKNAEIWINNSSAYTTGCAGNSVSEGEYLGCQNAYDSTIGFEASTTGNIYGIYDLSGNTAEYTAAYVNNNNINLNTNGSAIINADNKYKDVYLQGVGDARISNYALAINYKGDAIYEVGSSGDGTTAWYGDVSYMPYSNDPWFYRGGHCGHGVTAGYFYSSGNSGIGVGNYVGFHTVVLVGPGL